jgi:hypothetical protein
MRETVETHKEREIAACDTRAVSVPNTLAHEPLTLAQNPIEHRSDECKPTLGPQSGP